MALTDKRCAPCEGGTQPLSAADADALLAQTPGWHRTEARIHRDWKMHDFAHMLQFVNAIGALAEDEGHHPDLHMTNYRQLRIELTTHSIGGLSENDFILAAKINALPGAGDE